MPLILLPLTPADAMAYTRVRAAAWAGPTNDLLYNRPLSESSMRGLAGNIMREIGKPGMWHWKVVDTDLEPDEDESEDGVNGYDDEYDEDQKAKNGRTIAVAVWSIRNVDLKAQHHDQGNELKQQEPFVAPELRPEVYAALASPFPPSRLDIMGSEQPYLMLHTFATHPSHQKRGAGTLLLDWGISKADKEGICMYVESKLMAQVVYEKRGFRLVKEVRFDRGRFGGEGVDWHGCMVRECDARTQ